MNASSRGTSGISVEIRGSFYSAVIVEKNYYFPVDPKHNAWIFEWIYNKAGIQEGRDEALGQKLKKDIELAGIKCFEETIAKLLGHEPFRIRLTAQDFGDCWKVCESDHKAFAFFIPSIDWSQFEFSVLTARS